MATFRAPAGNGEVLAIPDFAAIPALVEENRRKLDRNDVRIGGLPLKELRVLARREVLALAAEFSPSPLVGEGSREAAGEGKSDTNGSGSPPTRRRSAADLPREGGGYVFTSPLAGEVAAQRRVGGERLIDPNAPLLVTGHQPELAHPGVWVKNFALAGLAKKLRGTAVHLVVDNDTLKSPSLRFPVLRDRDPTSVRLESLAFDRLDGQTPYEHREVHDGIAFDSFAHRAQPLWANWGYEPLLWDVWPDVVHWAPRTPIGERFTSVRRDRERAWGCDNLELPVSRLAATDAFARFARHILGDLSRFREVYNAAIRAYRDANHIRSDNHPAPELREGEAPFWVRTAGRRERATPTSDVGNLRPRALTLTLFARVCLGDFFIHGIGGGKYDEVTDAIIRDYFHIEPPAYQVLSATLHLPLPGFPSTPDDLKRAKRRVRDLHWNPQRHLPPGVATELLERKAALASAEPPRTDHAARREWFRSLQKVTEELQPFVFKQESIAKAELARVRAEVAANEVLQRRDYAWVLYPEETLRPFLQRFLDV